MNILLSPPIAFLIYIPLVCVIFWFGRLLAGPEKSNAVKSSTYGSGELAPTNAAAPGYKPFFIIAFFFAVLHLGMLVLGTGTLTPNMVPFLVGLVFVLLALILG
jgi:NADH:ubiquinone oxidoreductase subunit 3 (subunit A)